MVDKYNMKLCDAVGLDMLSDGIGEGMEKCRRIFPHKNKGEGHFAALLKRTEPNENCTVFEKKKEKRPDAVLNDAIKLWREFEKKTITIKLDGEFVLFGENLYLLPEYVNTDKLKVLRCGLHLGTVKRNRFEPSHALAHAFSEDVYINKVESPSDSDLVKKYMHGETVPSAVSGWCVIKADGFVLGWGNGSSGIVKNSYPKHLI